MPSVSGRLPLAGRVRVSAVQEPERPRIDWGGALAMCSLSAPGIADSGHSLSQHKTPSDGLVLGCVPDDDKRGISALLLQHQLGLGCYETAWTMLHKFRRAMVNLEREPLWGEVEVDETWVGGTQADLRGSRHLKGRKAALVLATVEKRGKASGRVRMAVKPEPQPVVAC